MIHRFIARNIQSFSFILALAVVGCIAPAVAQTPATVYVDADFAGANFGDTVQFTMPGGGTVEAEFGVNAFGELQNGVDAVDENGTVLLGSDIVEDLVAVDKALTLDGNGFTLSSTSPNFGVSIQSTDATIENLVVEDAGTFGIHQSPGSDNLVIRGTTVQNGGGTGFAMNCSSNILLQNISAFNNGGNGVSITNCTDVVIDGITTAGNQFTTFSAGIGIFSSETTCLPEGTDGVQITDSANISELVPVYTQVSSGSGKIANVDVPLNLGPALLGFGAQAEFYYNTVEAALNAADQAITDDPAAKPITYVRDRSADQLIVADFMSINAATTNAQVADSVSVAPGVYDESVLVAVDGISVLGPNADVAPWDTGRGTEARIQGFVRVTAPGTTVDGLEISPPDATTNDEGEAVRISNSPDGVSILNNIVRDFDENGVPEWEGIDGINVFGGDGADPVDSITVSNNLIDSISGRPTKGGAAGISIQGHVTNGLISGNRIRNVGMLDTPFSFGIVIRGTGNHEQTPSGVAVTGNQVESILSDPASEFRGVAFAVEAGSADITGNAASGNEWQFEDKTDTSGLLEQVLADNDFDRAAVVRENPIVVPVIFSSIQEAIDAAADDQIIEVSAGTYPESIQIATQGLTVRGANTGIPVSDRTAGDAAETVIDAQSGTHAVDIRATGVTLDGFSVTTSSGILRGIGETTSVTGTRIVNNFVYGFPDSIGINLAAGSSGAQLQGNAVSNVYAGIYLSANASAATVSGNFITGLAGGSGPDQGAAVVFEGNNTDVAVNGNELTGNAIGVFLFDLGPDLSGTEVSQNVIVGNVSGITNTNTSELQATCNWWGAADGPGGEGPGTGDSVTVNVVFGPWQTSAGGTCDGFADPVVRLSDGRQFADYSSALADAGTLVGDTLTGSAATYTESFTLDKAVSLAGAGQSDTLIAGQVAITAAGASGSPIQVSNLGISNPAGNGVSLDSGAAFIEFDSVSISDNGTSGINVNPDPAQPLIQGITIRNSTLSNNGSAGIRPSSNSYLVDWAIESNNINDNLNTGFLSAGGSETGTFRIDNLSVLNNVFIGNGGLDASPFGGAIWLKTTKGPDSFINNVLIQGNLFADNGSSNPANRFAITYQVRPDASSSAVVINNNTFQSTSTGGTQVFGVKVFDQTGGFGYRPAQITNNAFVHLVGAEPVIGVFGELSLETGYAVAAMSGNSFSGEVTAFEQISEPIQRLGDGELFSTFASAIADSGTSDGNELRAGTGLYAGNFEVDKALTVSGTGSDSAITGDPLLTGTAELNVGIHLPNGRDGVTIRDLRVEDVAGNCIFGRLGNNDTLIERVEANACQAAGAGGGIYFNGPVDGIIITESIVTNSTTRGIVIWNGFKTNITITDNEVTGNNCCGIELQDGTASGVTITGNLVTGNGDNGIGVVGLTSGAGPNRIADNTVTDNGRFGIEMKLPNGTGGLDELADGAIVVANNTVALTGGINALNPNELRDLAGIAVFRRGIADADNVDLPRGVTVRNNTVTGYLQNNAGSTSDGFGIVVEGVQMRVENNLLEDNDVGLQRQSGHQPYVAHEPGTDPTDPPQQDGDQGNLDDDFFGRGNAQQVCAITDANGFTNNGVDERDVIQAGPDNADPIAINQDRDTFYCLIQDGIDDALAGETLEVLPGSYTEQLVVDRAMTLVGDSSGVDRPVLGFNATATGLPALVRVQNADVTIDGFEFDVDMSWVGQGIRTEGDASGLQVLNNRFVSRFSGQAGPIGFGDRNAIFVNPVGRAESVNGGFAGVLISNNEIAVNQQSGSFTDFFRAGVAMDTATGSLVGNDILAATHDAIIRFTLGGSLVVDGNTFRGGGLQLAEFNATGPVSVSGNQFMPDNVIGFGTAESPTESSMRLQNNTNSTPVTVSGNGFADHTTGIRAENFPALTIENNSFDPYIGATSYRHIVVTNRVNVSNVVAPLEVDVAIAGNTFNGGASGGTAVEFSNLNCCDSVGSGTTTATFGALVVGGANPNAFAGDLDRYIVLDDTSGLVDFGLAQTEAQPFFADINAVGNTWDGVAGSAQSEAERTATRAKIIDNEGNPDLGQVILEEPELAVAPDSIDFGTAQVGSTTSPQQVVYTNNGEGVLEFELALPPAPFAVDENACGNGTVVLQPAEFCSVGYTFTPGSVNTFAETVIYTSNDPAGNRSLALEGVGIAAAAPATTPAAHDFAGVVVDQNSSFEFTIENAGDPLTSLTLQAPTVSGDAPFSVGGGTCASGTVLDGGQTCTVIVEFAPTATGNVSGSLDIGSNAGNVSAGLSGEGLAPAELQISPASTDFGSVLVTEPATTTFTLINAGDPVTTITLGAPALAAASDPSYSLVGGSCGSGTELVGGAAGCTVEVQFAPSSPDGPLTGTLEVTSDFNTVAATLEGSGELPDWSDAFANADGGSGGFEQDWSFQAFDANLTPIAPQTAQVTDDEFLQIRDPDAIFALGYVERTFDDTRTSALVNADGFGSGSDSGDGLDNQIDQGVIGRFDPATLSGYAAYMRMELDTQELVLIKFDGDNVDPALVDLRDEVATSADADWTMGRMYEVELDLVDQPDGSVLVVARALDAGTGTVLSRLTFEDPAADAFDTGFSGVLAIANATGLNGTFDTTAAQSSFVSADLEPAAIDFGAVQVGFADQQSVTLTNNGNAPLAISDISIGGAAPADYTLQANTCGESLPAGDSCSFEIAFFADATGQRSAEVVIQTDASTSPDVILLDADVFQAELAIDPAAVDFGSVLVGQTSAATSITVSNTGDPVTSIALTSFSLGGDFTRSGGDCTESTTLNGGESCTVDVVFEPQSAESLTGSLVVVSDLGDVSADLQGQGLEAAALAIDPADHDFNAVTIGSTAAFTFTLANTGDPASQLQLGAVSVLGTSAFSVSGGTCQADTTVLDGGQDCTVEVEFAPTVLGNAGGTLNVESDAGEVDAGLAGRGTDVAAPSIDLASFDYGDVLIGDAVSTSFVVSNTGGAASSLTLQGLNANGADFSISGGTCVVGSVLGSSEECTVSVEFAPSVPGPSSGTLEIDSDAGQVQAQLSGTGISEIDLRITGNASPDPVIAGTNVVYALNIDNLNSIGDATGVTVESTLPTGASLVESAGCVEPQGVPTCTIDGLAAGESSQVSLTVFIPSDLTGDLDFSAVVSGDQDDPNSGNDATTISTSLAFQSDLAAVIEPVTEFVPSTENEVQFIVVVTNSGPSDVIEAVVASELGAGLVDIDWTCEAGPGGSCVDEAGTDDVAGLVDLETGGSATYLITSVLADPDSDQDITSSAIIVEPENVSDPDINNNEDEAAIRTGVFADGFESPPIP